MAINWQKLEIDIKNFLEAGKNDTNYNISKTSAKIEDLYIIEIKLNATDIFLNRLTKITTSEFIGLHKSLEDGFNNSLKNNDTSILNNTGIKGVLDNWSKAQFSILTPAPGMAVGVNNVVNVVGSITSLNLSGNSNTHDLFSNKIVTALKLHAATIQGIFTGVTAAGNPISVPWTGII